MSHTRMTTLPFLLLVLSPFVIFDRDYALISCPVCNMITLRNILMILGTNVEHDETTCHLQELQLWRGWGGWGMHLLFFFLLLKNLF